MTSNGDYPHELPPESDLCLVPGEDDHEHALPLQDALLPQIDTFSAPVGIKNAGKRVYEVADPTLISDACAYITKTKRKKASIDWNTRSTGFHYPEHVYDGNTEETPDGRKVGKVIDKRRNCRCCLQKCRVRCVVCDVYLCTAGVGENNCFYRFHTMPHFTKGNEHRHS